MAETIGVTQPHESRRGRPPSRRDNPRRRLAGAGPPQGLSLLGRSRGFMRCRTMVATRNQCADVDYLRWNARNHTQVPVAMNLSYFRHRLDALGIEAIVKKPCAVASPRLGRQL